MVILHELSEGSSSSSSTNDHKYDVFLSFSGSDTRCGFTDHLYKAFVDANINTFLADEDIETGEDLKPELESAIKASRASVIVISKNYASSTWCLNELKLILEQRRNSDHIVIPIFYHVEPTDVRKQQSSFGDAMAKHKQRMEEETNAEKRSEWAQKMELWKKALTEVANLKGHDVNGRLETEFIEEIVTHILHRLGVLLRSTLPDLIGMDNSVQFITSWLKDGSSHAADVLTILGMGGIGKTSLAKYVYGLHYRLFQKSSFIDDISTRCAEPYNGLLDLQKQLCADISKTSPVQVHDVSVYTSKIKNTLAHKKVLLVLDDVDSLDQLNALLGNKGFLPGSKIIITTKDASLTEKYALRNPIVQPKHTTHLLEGLNETASLQLLSFHAFMCNGPKEGYEEVSKKLVKYCEGHPLALKVLGSSLCNRDVAEWEDYMEGLNKETDSRIKKVLQMSFDSLPSQNDKELFKHIACFFVGKDRVFAETVLKACGIRTQHGIRNLIDRCLLTIGPRNELMMHQLLQEMGRDVVRQESLDKPWKRSRLWCPEESFNVLKQKKGKGNLKGLILDMRMLEKQKLRGSFELKTDAFSKMNNLMLLQLNYVQLNGPYKNFPEEVRWLCMHGFPLNSLPSDLPMENLVALDLSYSKIESFDMSYSNLLRPGKRQKLIGSCSKDKWLLGSLKILNLSFCCQLRSLGGFSKLPALERLILASCKSLIELRRLGKLGLEGCSMLMAMEHPSRTFRNLNFSRWDLLQKIIFDPEMSPLAIALSIYSLAHSSIEIEGIVKTQPIADVEEEVLRSLGWTNLEFIKNQEVETWHDWRGTKKSRVQMYYEFGIFSIFYGGKEIPNWISHKSKGSSISFTMPSSPNNLRGLNFCHVQTGRDQDDGINLLTVIISNITKNRTWIYKHYIHWVKVDEECLIWLSHWMFGENEMEDSDQVTITIAKEDVSANVSISECGMSFVYDDGNLEEDPLSYYKSWNHIIGGDLSAFHLTTGEYFLDNQRFFWWHTDYPVYRPFIADGAYYEEEGVYFGAFPQRKSDVVGGTPEDVME